MTFSEPNDEKRCPFCGEPMTEVPIGDIGPDTTYISNCTNVRCADGPSGLLRIRTRDRDTCEPTSVTKLLEDGSFEHAAVGAPSRNEDNVEMVAKTFMDAVNREFGTSFDKYIPGPVSSRDERGYDCELLSRADNIRFRIQVTRGLPAIIYQNQAKDQRRRLDLGVQEAANWVMEAIRHKTNRASQDIALVVDGVDAPFLAIHTDIVVSAAFQTEIESQGWHSVWVVGPGGARQLAGRPLP